jgi:hypothetical protein
MKTTNPVGPAVTIAQPASVQGQKQTPHIRLPQRSDKVEGKEADCAAVSSDPRTASQDPHSAPKVQQPIQLEKD